MFAFMAISFSKWFTPISIHPLFPATLFFMTGIWFNSLQYSFYYSFVVWTLSIVVTLSFRSLFPLLFASCFIIGIALHQQTIQRFILFHREINNKNLDVTLSVTDVTTCDHRFLKYCISGKIKQLIDGDKQVNHANQTILWFSPKKTDIKIGDSLKFSNVQIKCPKHESMKNYFFKQNVVGTIIANDYELLERPYMNFYRWLVEYRLALLRSLKQKLSKKAFLFISLLFFGNKQINKKQLLPLQQQCKAWGISHYLARSGLHLILFILLWELILKALPLSYFLKNGILCLLTLIYVFFSWISVSFLRSLASFLFYKISSLLYQQVHPVHLISIITFFTLLLNPLHLFFLDFQLSFGITFLLTWGNFTATQQTVYTPKNS